MDRSRRRFLTSLGAGLPLAGLAGCSGSGPDGRQDRHDPTKTMRVQGKVVAKCEEDRNYIMVFVSPDGKRIVSGSSDCTLRFFDGADGRLLRKVQVAEPAKEGGGAWARFTPEGKHLIVTVRIPRVGTRTHFRDADGGKEVPNPYPFPINSWIVSSVGGRQVAVPGGGVQIWDLSTSRKVRALHYAAGDVGDARQAAFSPDGTLLAAAIGTAKVWSDKVDPPLSPSLQVWDVATGKVVFRGWETAGGRYSPSEVEFSPDGRQLVAAGSVGVSKSVPDGYKRACPLQVWDVNSWKPRHAIHADKHGVKCLAFHPDSRLLASGGRKDPAIKIWDLATGELATTLEGHTKSVDTLAFSPDGKKLVSAGQDNQVLIWRVEQK